MLDSVLVIRFQILVRTETGGGPAGPPFFILKQEEGKALSKPFLTYDQQLYKLQNEKNFKFTTGQPQKKS